MILVAQGYKDTNLGTSLTISLNGLWIIGAPIDYITSLYPVPTIDLSGYTITISASNVFIWGLEFYQSGTLSTSTGLLISGGNNFIENDTIIGSGTADGISITSSSSSNNIANNTITNWNTGIYIQGSSNFVDVNNLNYYTYAGIWVDTPSAGGNMIWTNNVPYTSATYAIYDTSYTSNTYDNGVKGNYYDSWDSVFAPYTIPGSSNVDHHPRSNNSPPNKPFSQVAGDLGGYPPGSFVPKFGYFDGSCGVDDIPLFIQVWRRWPYNSWGQYYYDPRADLTDRSFKPFNRDGLINILDFIKFVRQYYSGASDPPAAVSAVKAAAVTGDPSTTVYVYPQNTTALRGQTITVNITVSGASNLVGWQAAMVFNPSVLTCLGVQQGPFLNQSGSTLWIAGSINNTTGTLGLCGCAFFSNSSIANGEGTLATVQFQCNAVGSTAVNLEDVILVNSTLQEIPIVISNGSVSALPSNYVNVVFGNGLNTINVFRGCNFNVSINIYNPPVGIGYYCIRIKWNTSALSLQTGTNADIVEGPWMKHFGSTLWVGPKINNTLGTALVPDGLLTNASGAIGNGTMFTVAFHALALSPMVNITIVGPNTSGGSYMLNGTMTGEVPISAVNGSVLITKAGDLGGYPSGSVVPQFGHFDGSCGADDIPLFIECYRGTAPPQWMYLGDLGGYPPGSVVPQFFYFDGKCGADDIPLFIQCYRGQGP
jgi:hypothetical protein